MEYFLFRWGNGAFAAANFCNYAGAKRCAVNAVLNLVDHFLRQLLRAALSDMWRIEILLVVTG
ncbi:hypothetical protein D3C71_1418600 [compost metagenome]